MTAAQANGVRAWTDTSVADWTVGELLETLAQHGVLEPNVAMGLFRDIVADLAERTGRLERTVPADLPAILANLERSVRERRFAPVLAVDGTDQSLLRRRVEAFECRLERLGRKLDAEIERRRDRGEPSVELGDRGQPSVDLGLNAGAPGLPPVLSQAPESEALLRAAGQLAAATARVMLGVLHDIDPKAPAEVAGELESGIEAVEAML